MKRAKQDFFELLLFCFLVFALTSIHIAYNQSLKVIKVFYVNLFGNSSA